MEKRFARVGIVVIFAAALTVSTFTDQNTLPSEMGDLQRAMRSLKRADNVAFSYVSKTSGDETDEMASVDVWANNLDGSWVAEYAATDEDGTLPLAKRFCDGQNVYEYNTWSEEWELCEGEDADVPNLDMITTFFYDGEAILELAGEWSDGCETVSYRLAPDYLETLGAQDASVSYSIDEAGVLSGGYFVFTLAADEVADAASDAGEADADEVAVAADNAAVAGESADGTIRVHIGIQIKRYNQDGIVNKIEQCRNEMW